MALGSKAVTSGTGSVGTSSALLVPANISRRELTIVNDHATQVVYLAFDTAGAGATPTALASGWRVLDDERVQGPCVGDRVRGVHGRDGRGVLIVVGVSNPPPPQAQMPLQVGTVNAVAPDATPALSVTPTLPQTLTASIPTGGTRVQKTTVATNAAGSVTWAFPTPFQNPPAIAVVPEQAAGDGVSDVLTCKVTAVSASAVTVVVQRQAVVSVALISLSVQVLQGSPGVHNVHIYAAPNPS